MKIARVIEDAEFKRVIAVINSYKHKERNKVIFYLSYGLGLRACEIAALKITDVVDEYGVVKVEILLKKEQTKGSDANSLIVSEQLQKRLQYYVNVTTFRKSNLAFIQSQKGAGFTGLTITQLFKKFYGRAGIYLASGHSGRRRVATVLNAQGVNIKIIQHLMRHKNISTTMRYIETDSGQLRKAIELVTI